MYRTLVNSSNIKSIGYDISMAVLEVEFIYGDVYQYFNVPSNLYQEFMDAPSKGKFFDDYVKYNYRYRKG